MRNIRAQKVSKQKGETAAVEHKNTRAHRTRRKTREIMRSPRAGARMAISRAWQPRYSAADAFSGKTKDGKFAQLLNTECRLAAEVRGAATEAKDRLQRAQAKVSQATEETQRRMRACLESVGREARHAYTPGCTTAKASQCAHKCCPGPNSSTRKRKPNQASHRLEKCPASQPAPLGTGCLDWLKGAPRARPSPPTSQASQPVPR
jgi:hypothetical protein